MKKITENHEYTIDIVGVIKPSRYYKEENKNKFLIEIDNPTGNFNIEFIKKGREFIWNRIFEIICSGYVIDEFICKDMEGKTVFVDVSKVQRGEFDYRHSGDYLFQSLPESSSYCKVYFKPKYDVILRSIKHFNNELYYNCSEEEKKNIMANGKININKKKTILNTIPSEYFIKFNHNYGNGYKLNFFENIKTGEVFSYDTFSNKALILN